MDVFCSLDLQYVDAISTVRYIMGDAIRKDMSNKSEILSRMGSSTLNLLEIKDPHIALKTEIKHILDSKAQELTAASKGKKKEETATEDADYSGDALTEELCSCIPNVLVRECVLMRINNDPKCIKKGYVLDMWKSIFSNLVEYLEVSIGHKEQKTENDDSNGSEADKGEEPKNAEEDECAENSAPQVKEIYLAGETALIIELQVGNRDPCNFHRALIIDNTFAAG